MIEPWFQRAVLNTRVAAPRFLSRVLPKREPNSWSVTTSPMKKIDSPEGARLAIDPPAALLVIPSPTAPMALMSWNPPDRQLTLTMKGTGRPFVRARASAVVRNVLAPKVSNDPRPMKNMTAEPELSWLM